MFRKVLIANRGEIAVRIIRACRDLGIVPVAVYSEPDRASLHVRLADEAYLLGPAPSFESYLAIDRILEAARRAQVEAIHPGYGFLSENPHFAEACAGAGIPLIGPSAESMRLMGNKTNARAFLRRHGIPIIPGTERPVSTVEDAKEQARRLGYPVMIKAVAGGGGKGIRLVTEEPMMEDGFATAASEAGSSFSDSSLYLEKYLVRPHHVEIQVLADRHGNVIHLGERECSLQRRRQKLLEECPSPLLDDELRGKMGEVAIRVARASHYENAGTVEFLVDENRIFYFLEMNTRLQVEHPVTEAVTGIDMVCEQFRIAAGEPLSMSQEQVPMRGWAMECRICAEDPDNDLFPSPGIIRRLQEPQGPGIRLDSGVYTGWEVTIDYDPLLAKLIAFGADREQAVARMKRALREYRIAGIRTNIPIFVEILSNTEFLAGHTYVGLLEEILDRRGAAEGHAPSDFNAHALGAALAYAESSEPSLQPDHEAESPWKLSGRPGLSGIFRK